MTRYAPQWLQAGSYPASLDRRLVGALWPVAASTGCAVTPGAAMSANVASGQVAVPTQNNSGSTLCSSDATENVVLAAAPGTNSRIDLIVCQPRGNDLDGGANNDFIFTAVTGTVAASPVAPAAPAGSAALAQVLVTTGMASVPAGNITDLRPGGLNVGPGSVNRAAVRAYRTAAFTFPATANQLATLIYDTKVFDQANAYNASTGVYTCPVTGLYLIRASWSLAGVSASTLNVISLKNGTNNAMHIAPPLAATGALLAQISTLDQCNAGDTITFNAQTATASATSRLAMAETHMAIACLGPP